MGGRLQGESLASTARIVGWINLALWGVLVVVVLAVVAFGPWAINLDN